MTCTACKHEWCWSCGDAYEGPDHFRGGRCVQFDDDYFEELGISRADYYRFVGRQ